MKNNGAYNPWTIKNVVITVNSNEEARKVERAAEKAGLEVDGWDVDDDDKITSVSITGDAEKALAFEAVYKLVAADVQPEEETPAAPEITPLVITDGLDIFQAHDLIDTLSGYKGTEAAIYAIENWAEENAPAFAIKYANEGRTDDADALLEIYDGEGDDDWADVVSAINAARRANEEESEAEDTDDAGDVFDRLVAAWRGNPANENIDALLEANGLDTENEPGNLYRAGVFNGLATAAAWMIYATITPEDDADDINAITAAVYKAYGVAW